MYHTPFAIPSPCNYSYIVQDVERPYLCLKTSHNTVIPMLCTFFWFH